MDGPGLASLAANPTLPVLDAAAWLQLIILVVALVFCVAASAAEAALTSISRIKLKNLIGEGDQRAREVERLVSEPNSFLSTILMVNTIALIAAASVATLLALRFFTSWEGFLVIALFSLVVLIFCEITPKTLVVQNPLRWAYIFVRPVLFVAWWLHPLVWSLEAITALLISAFGGKIKHRGPFVTEEELRLMVTASEEEGVLEEEETEMIYSIFEFADTTVREVMVPRIDMVTLGSDTTVIQAVDLALEGGFSRIPVYESQVGVDEIIGVLYTKDMLKQLREGHHSLPIRDLARPAYFVPETKKLDDLLREIRQNRIHIVIVVDEYGSVAGLVTIEDLVEEIVGDIKDEYDREENLYEKVHDNEYIFDAKISIYDFNNMMNMHLDDADYETLGGFVYAQLDKIPNAGDVITYEDLIFTVLQTRGRRITKIRVERQEEQQEPEQSASEKPEPERSERRKKSDQLLLPAPTPRQKEASQPS